MKTEQITRPQHGTCSICRKRNIAIQKELLIESEDHFIDRTNGEGDYYNDTLKIISVCRSCFVIPEEDDWDENGDYPSLNQRNTIWLDGDWSSRTR